MEWDRENGLLWAEKHGLDFNTQFSYLSTLFFPFHVLFFIFKIEKNDIQCSKIQIRHLFIYLLQKIIEVKCFIFLFIYKRSSLMGYIFVITVVEALL